MYGLCVALGSSWSKQHVSTVLPLTAMRLDLVTAEAPVNGFAMLNHCDILHLSASVSEEALGLAWSLLKAGNPSLPDDLLLAPLRHHAMLAHLCDVRRGLGWTLASCGSAAAAVATVQLFHHGRLLPNAFCSGRCMHTLNGMVDASGCLFACGCVLAAVAARARAGVGPQVLAGSAGAQGAA